MSVETGPEDWNAKSGRRRFATLMRVILAIEDNCPYIRSTENVCCRT